MARYDLVDSFGVDDGELDGLTPAECFTLGVEWQLFRRQLSDETGAFTATVNVRNADRLVALAQRHGRAAKASWIHDDFETWRKIEVEAEQHHAG